MNIDQITEVIRDGFTVESQGFAASTIMDRFFEELCSERDSFEQELEESAKYLEEHPDYIPDGSDEFEHTMLMNQLDNNRIVREWVKSNVRFDVALAGARYRTLQEEFKVIDSMTDRYLECLDSSDEHPTRTAFWDAMQEDRSRVLNEKIALGELVEFLEHGRVL